MVLVGQVMMQKCAFETLFLVPFDFSSQFKVRRAR